jgi:uncharacterized protein YkwD
MRTTPQCRTEARIVVEASPSRDVGCVGPARRLSSRAVRAPRAQAGRLTLAVVAALTLAVTAPGAIAARQASQPTADPALESAIAGELNAARRARGKGGLAVSGQLATAARRHALQMGRLGYFSHTSADGSSPTRRITSYYAVHGIHWSVGEVLLWTSGNTSASEAVAHWLASAPHARELLGRWRELGVAAVHVDDAPGVYGGQNVTILVADFGRR